MKHFSIYRRVREYLTTIALLLVLALPLGFIVNCGFSDSNGTEDLALVIAIVMNFWYGEKACSTAGDSQVFEIGIALTQGAESSVTTLSWTPPEGAASFEFEGLEPTNPAGPPPFVFSNPPVNPQAPATPDLRVRYVATAVAGGFRFIDSFLLTTSSGAVQVFDVSHDASEKASVDQVRRPAFPGDAPKAEASGWRWNKWLYTDAFDLEREQAESLVDYLQGGDFFIGLRFPVPQDSDVLGYQAPVVMPADDTAHIAILDHSMPWGGNDLSQAVADVELEYDLAHQSFLENSLPRQDQTRWTALRPKSDPITMEDRFPVEANNWELYSTGLLNLPEMPDSCRECVLEVYFCHEGAEEPAILDFLSGKKLFSFQGDGITCFGPTPHRLTENSPDHAPDPRFILESLPFAKVDPGTQGQFYVDISVPGDSAVSMNLNLQSSSGLSWSLYRGDLENPDLSRPITGALQVAAHQFETIWIVGDIPAEAQGLETIRVTASDASDESKSTWTAISLWIGDWIPPESEEWSAWIPVASHAAGAQGSAWRTDLGLLNSGTADLEATISLMSSAEVSMQQSIAPGSQLILGDVVDRLGISGAGSLKIAAPGALVMTSRTYSQVGSSASCYPSGTLGQSLASSDDGVILLGGQSALIPQLTENAAYRTNIAATNTGQTDAVVRVHLFDGGGTELTSYETNLSPGEWKQENQPFFKKAQQTDMVAGYAEIEVLSGTGVVGYGSVVDNETNDPTTMAPVPLSEASGIAWVPVGSHASGANGSAWRTDLGLLNPGDTAVDAQIRYHASGGTLSMSREIPAGTQLILSDVVDLLGASGAAALEVSSSSGVIVTSRTYSQVGPSEDCYPGGTLGQSLASTAQSGTIAAGQSALIPQLTENQAYRSNIAVTNTSSEEAEVRVHLYDAGGLELTSYDVPLDPGQWKQENQPFFKKAAQSDMEAGYVRIEVLLGSGIAGYGSVVDNITNDPTTMPMIR